MSGESITIASSRNDEHSLCYAMSPPKTELFDPELLILRIQRRFRKNQGDIRNQRMKLRWMSCNTIHLLTKNNFRKISRGLPTRDFCKSFFIEKMVYFVKVDFLSDI
jgi:hypothetical protein